MKHESENRVDADDKTERVLKSLQPTDQSNSQSDGQLMYAMGFAAGVAEAQGDTLSPPTASTTSNRLWQFAAIAATVVAAVLSYQLLNKVSGLDSNPVVENQVEASEDGVTENTGTAQETLDSPSKRVLFQPADSLVKSFFVGHSQESAFSRRGQILAAAGSVDLDQTLERIAYVALHRNPVRTRNNARQAEFSPRSAMEDLLKSDEFLGL